MFGEHFSASQCIKCNLRVFKLFSKCIGCQLEVASKCISNDIWSKKMHFLITSKCICFRSRETNALRWSFATPNMHFIIIQTVSENICFQVECIQTIIMSTKNAFFCNIDVVYLSSKMRMIILSCAGCVRCIQNWQKCICF